MNCYLPEGELIASGENREYVSSLAGLERARQSGRILEAVALMCDEDMSLTVDLGGIRGTIPKSEALFSLTGEDVKDIAVLTRVGKPVCFTVLGITKGRDGRPEALLSRRAAQAECMRNYIMTLSPGDVIDAKVTHMEQFGAFVDIGCGMVSLLSIDCISVSRISHPKDRFCVGMPLKTVVRSVDPETGRVCVSHKELLGTWEENASLFSVGQTVAGKIRSVEDYGVFVELTPNLAGLAELRDGVTAGQSAAVYIKNIIPERMKIKLVIVDTGKCDGTVRPPEYYPAVSHIDRWVYSPESSGKVIETVFTNA